jgi:hypothetical protein
MVMGSVKVSPIAESGTSTAIRIALLPDSMRSPIFSEREASAAQSRAALTSAITPPYGRIPPSMGVHQNVLTIVPQPLIKAVKANGKTKTLTLDMTATFLAKWREILQFFEGMSMWIGRFIPLEAA